MNKLNFQAQLQHLDALGNHLLDRIDKKNWDDALHYSHEWSMCIRSLFNSLNSEQLEHYQDELIELDARHRLITDKLIRLRAKTLTQLQEMHNHRTVNEYYNTIE